MNLEITTLPEERWEESKKIRLEALKNDPTAFGSSYEEEIKFSDEKWKARLKNGIYALINNKPVGLISYLVNTRLKTKHTAEIHAVYVNENSRGKGIGKMLVSEALKEIQKNPDVIKVELGVMAQQEAAIKLYEHFGFKQVGKYSKASYVDGKYYDAYIMELFVKDS